MVLSDRHLRRKITLTLGGKQFVLVKKPGESMEHVLGKAAAVALYRTAYPDLSIEVPVGDKYKPDVVSLDHAGRPRFWAESGTVSKQKLTKLFKRYPDTHFVFLRFGAVAPGFRTLVERCIPGGHRGTVEVLGLPHDLAERLETGLRRTDCERYMMHRRAGDVG